MRSCYSYGTAMKQLTQLTNHALISQTSLNCESDLQRTAVLRQWLVKACSSQYILYYPPSTATHNSAVQV